MTAKIKQGTALIRVFLRSQNSGVVVAPDDFSVDVNFSDGANWDRLGISYLLVEKESVAFNCFSAQEFERMIDSTYAVKTMQASRVYGIVRNVPREFENMEGHKLSGFKPSVIVDVVETEGETNAE